MSYFKNSENEAKFIGNLGADVETKELERGGKVSKFNIATNKVYKDPDGTKTEKTIWVPCEVWGDHPALPYLTKGKQVYVTGHYDNSKKGEGEETKYYHVFRTERIQLLGSGNYAEANEKETVENAR